MAITAKIARVPWGRLATVLGDSLEVDRFVFLADALGLLSADRGRPERRGGIWACINGPDYWLLPMFGRRLRRCGLDLQRCSDLSPGSADRKHQIVPDPCGLHHHYVRV